MILIVGQISKQNGQRPRAVGRIGKRGGRAELRVVADTADARERRRRARDHCQPGN